jgi:hypothetical protein
MAINLSALAPATTAATTLSGLILATPQDQLGYQPQNPPTKDGAVAQPPPTLLFNYEGEQDVTLTSEITDHFIEDNTTIQDQVALKPETIMTHGFVGELNDVVPKALKPLKLAATKLSVMVAYTPQLTETALIAYTNAVFAYSVASQVVNAGVAAWSSIAGGAGKGVQSKQGAMFQQFYGYWQKRTLFTVQTPWGVFNDCAILSLRAIQDAETRTITDFNVTFKKMRFAKTTTISAQTTNLEGRAATQDAGLVDLGASTPEPSITIEEAMAQNLPGVA